MKKKFDAAFKAMLALEGLRCQITIGAPLRGASEPNRAVEEGPGGVTEGLRRQKGQGVTESGQACRGTLPADRATEGRVGLA